MKMQLRITPQLVLAGELLRVSGVELERRIRQELAENPALEQMDQHSARDESWDKSMCRYTDIHLQRKSDLVHDQRDLLSPPEESLERMAGRESVIDQLTAQARVLVDREDLEAVTALLYALDVHGYLRDSPEQLADHLSLELADIERLIPVLHELEPPGIGARDLRECLLIQCRDLEREGMSCALVRQALEQCWEDFAAQRWERVARKLGISRTEFETVRCFIAQNFYPHPLALMKDDPGISTALNRPDMIISRYRRGEEIAFSLEIPAAEAFELRLSNGFNRVMEDCSSGDREISIQEREWVQSQLERARLFIASLQKRWETLRRIGEYIIDFQRDFLERGPSHLRPLTQARIASDLECHESTVSRAVNDKIVQLPDGRLVSVEVFFDASLPVKAALRQILAESRKSISDREMSERLAQAGYPVARRTVAKYRAQINQVNSF
jgi:RNA polymerase sigma-54 factor